MKLILVPSNPNHGPRVAISVPQDGGDIDAFLETVVAPALVAFGWSPQSVQDAMHRVEVPGAVEEEPETSDRPPSSQTTDEHPIAPAPPVGFTIVGFDVRCSDPDGVFDDGDLEWYSGSRWYSTGCADGGYWYAARDGSETLAKLQAHVASL
jgi:hypothetical protein